MKLAMKIVNFHDIPKYNQKKSEKLIKKAKNTMDKLKEISAKNYYLVQLVDYHVDPID